MRLMILVLCLYIILMPRSLCVCVHLGVTFTLIFIINYYYCDYDAVLAFLPFSIARSDICNDQCNRALRRWAHAQDAVAV